MTNLNQLITKIQNQPGSVIFNEVIEFIDKHYHYTPTQFSNGTGNETVYSEAGENEGSCKLFAFAQLNGLTLEQTLHCFGDYYRIDVLENPGDNNHANIRAFIKHGWEHVNFSAQPLEAINK